MEGLITKFRQFEVVVNVFLGFLFCSLATAFVGLLGMVWTCESGFCPEPWPRLIGIGIISAFVFGGIVCAVSSELEDLVYRLDHSPDPDNEWNSGREEYWASRYDCTTMPEGVRFAA